MSSIQFYSDSACTIAVGVDTGPSDGTCTLFGTSDFASFKVISLQQTCAVTVYNSDVAFCSSSILSVANFGECYTNTSVNQFSVDCQSTAIAETAIPSTLSGAPRTSSSAGTYSASDAISASSSAGTSLASDVPSTGTTVTTIITSGANAGATVTIVSTASPSSITGGSVSGTTSAIPAASGLSTGAEAGIGVGATLVGLLVILAIAFLVLRKHRRKTAATSTLVADEKSVEGVFHTNSLNDEKGSHPSLPYSYELSSEEKKVAELATIEKRNLLEAPGDDRWPGPHELDASTSSGAT